MSFINWTRSWYGRFERPISSLSLIAGFVFDALTLKRVDLANGLKMQETGLLAAIDTGALRSPFGEAMQEIFTSLGASKS